MKLSDLKTGYVIMLRSGKFFKVLKDFNGEENRIICHSLKSPNTVLDLKYWKEDLRYPDNIDLDVVKVFKGNPICNVGELLWERKEVDWTKVEVDTPIYVRNDESSCWKPRHFSKYCDGKVYAFIDGATSYTTISINSISYWKYAKLKED